MGNINKDILWSLFRSYLIRKEKESNVPCTSYGGRCGGISTAQDYTGYKGMIYFYEWSDINRSPITFYSITAFVEFLDRCGIFIPPFQKDMLRNLDRAYVICKKGKKDLLIRGTRPGLLEALGRDDAPGVSIHDLPTRPNPMAQPVSPQLRLPYPVSCTYPPGRMPPMYANQGRPEEWLG